MLLRTKFVRSLLARIVAAREAGATQKEVAAAEGISQPRVAQVEREQREYKERQSAVSYNAPPPRSQQYGGISAELPRAPVQPTPYPQRGEERAECANDLALNLGISQNSLSIRKSRGFGIAGDTGNCEDHHGKFPQCR